MDTDAAIPTTCRGELADAEVLAALQRVDELLERCRRDLSALADAYAARPEVESAS